MVEFPLSYVSRPPEEPTTDAPAVLLLHGYGADEADLLSHADYLPSDLHVLSVRGPHPAGENEYAWMASGRDLFGRSVELLGEFAERVPDAYDVDPHRVGLFGFSQGAKAALAALVTDPQLYRWAVAMNGYLPREYADRERVARARERSVFVGVGEDDAVISPDHGEDSADFLADAELDVTFRSYPVGHRIAAEAVDDVAEWLRSRR
ncbi:MULTISPECIES: alpha/beta hydrolase [Halorussus]|uniref:alpha/beta hydrolase n=1 Tax=Halorussus TaxID=1070314 RepID=UPI00209EDF1B|nr:dienelactone hydrolase family protein [Halorussus vallis]USZ75641.1 dienelactone hydrolase family protein [Halorussus vallis]